MEPVQPTLTPEPPQPPLLTKPLVSIDEFAKMDIRIGTIVAAEMVPETDKLIACTIDFGAVESGGIGTRTIVSGIKAYRTPEQLVGKQVPYIVNLQPRMIKGVESRGMLLAMSFSDVENADGFALMHPDGSVPAGTKIK
jgi:methionyl-tRNA synthetase